MVLCCAFGERSAFGVPYETISNSLTPPPEISTVQISKEVPSSLRWFDYEPQEPSVVQQEPEGVRLAAWVAPPARVEPVYGEQPSGRLVPVGNLFHPPTTATVGTLAPYANNVYPPAYAQLMPGAGTTIPHWQVLPSGLIYRSYQAGMHESRIAGVPHYETSGTRLLDVSLGGRTAVLRYGTNDSLHPQGWELSVEGAGILRLNLDENWDVEATDFRFGVPLTYGKGIWQYKFAAYHLSSHLGDEFIVRFPAATRINFSRDVLVVGASVYPIPSLRIYGEAGFAIHYDGGTKPWEFQTGFEFSRPGQTGSRGTPFLAVNGHLREEHNFGGDIALQTGWLWRGPTGKTMRLGFHYFNGKSSQFQFFDQHEEQIGGGLWYDF